jgi:NTP pyrophosphatase (non-canonical NTP hydrolase)
VGNNVNLSEYAKFVLAVCSEPSKNLTAYMDRLDELDANYDPKLMGYGPDINVPLLLTAALGLGSESGEFQEIVKKVYFQGKPMTDETVHHAKRELGDIIWYWANACNALGLDPDDVIAENVKKLEARYPGGKFDVHYSENRKDGDL